jgi:hypothetical protein
VPTHINLAWDSLRGGRPEHIDVITRGLPVNAGLAETLTRNASLGVIVT